MRASSVVTRRFLLRREARYSGPGSDVVSAIAAALYLDEGKFSYCVLNLALVTGLKALWDATDQYPFSINLWRTVIISNLTVVL